MIRRRRLAAIVVVIVAVCSMVSVAWQGNAYAAQTSSVGGNSLKVFPVRQDVTADPGSTKTITVFIQNLTNVTTKLHPAINDFTAGNDENGRPAIILNENEYAPSHSLKRLVSSLKDFTIKANETKEISIPITIPKDAAGGGYYGAVRFEPAGENPSETINLSASVGSLVLLRVNGNITEQVGLESFDVRQSNKPGTFFTNKKDLNAVIRFSNSGNVHASPFGKVVVKKGSREVSSIEINTSKPLASVLPDSVRRFEVPLDKVGSFGKYSVEGNFGYGTTGQLLSAKKTIYVVPLYLLIGVGIVLVLAVLLAIIIPRMVRNYNQRVIRRASRRR